MEDLDTLLELGRLLAEGRTNRNGRDIGLHLAGKVLCVRNRAGQTQRLHPNPAQVLFDRRKGRTNIILKARQMGITTWIAGRFFLKTITQPGVLTVQVAHTREAAEGIFTMVQRMWENLPTEWKRGPLRQTRCTTGRMVFGALDSEFRVLSAGEENAGRGLTIQNLHLSEMSRWPGDAAATFSGLRAALIPGGELTIESTPNGAQGAFYEEWIRAGQSGADGPGASEPDSAAESGTVQHFFPWWLEPAYRGPAATRYTEEEQALVRRHALTPEQIGYRRLLERSFRTLRTQEYAEDPESCFRASGDCCFTIDRIEERLAQVTDPVSTRRGGSLQIWLPPQARLEYILGVDTAGGGSEGDYAAIQVIERKTGLQCAELRERLHPLELARIAVRLATEYGGALIAVERNNHGSAVHAYLDANERYGLVYEVNGVPGYPTTALSKPGLVSRMGVLLEERANLFSSRRLLAECRSFVTFAGGKTGAAPGAHDDCLMAMAIAQAVRAESLKLMEG